jgi:phosphate uptake regulator
VRTRKLQKVGGSTFTVSVPKEWAREQGLEAGAQIHLYEHGDGSLVVRSSEKDGGELASARVELGDDGDEAVERAIEAAYAAGFAEIELVATDVFAPSQRRTAGALARTLVGAEVVETGDDRIVVRNLLDSADVSVRQSLLQLQFATLATHRTATESVVAGGPVDGIAARADEADRLFEMITRHFNRSLTDFDELDRLGVDRTTLFEYYRTARQLRRVAGDAVEIGRIAEELDEPVPEETATEIESLADDARRVVDDATDAVLDGCEAEVSHRVLDRRDEAIAEIRAVDRALFERAPADAYRLIRVLDGLVRTVESGGEIAEIAVQSAVRDGE